jgi:hypothetical protein
MCAIWITPLLSFGKYTGIDSITAKLLILWHVDKQLSIKKHVYEADVFYVVRIEIISRTSSQLRLESSAQGYNWTTLFLGDINKGTWPSRLGESQMRQ